MKIAIKMKRVLFALPAIIMAITPFMSASVFADPAINEYPTPTPGSSPTSITKGPDGALWFTENGVNQIGRISTSGNITEYPTLAPFTPPGETIDPGGSGGQGGATCAAGSACPQTVSSFSASPQNITAGSDGALWFTENGVNKIGRITTDGATITEYTIPNPADNITAGPDGALWFTEGAAGNIGRLGTDGTVSEFTLPNQSSDPIGITTGPDSALWFTENAADQIGRITTDGTITEYPNASGQSVDGDGYATSSPCASTLPQQTPPPQTTNPGGAGSQASGAISSATGTSATSSSTPSSNLACESSNISTGPDGALWFTEKGISQIGRITTDGTITQYTIPNPAYDISAGSDGALWFTESGVNKIGQITTSGEVTEYPVSDSPAGIVSGPDGALWFAEGNSNQEAEIGQLIPDVPTAPTFTSPTTAQINARDVANVTVTTNGTPTAAITESGALPTGISFQDNGDGTATFSGQASPINNGYYPVTLTATNRTGTTTQTFTLAVNNAQTAPTFVDPPTTLNETYGQAFSVTVDTTGNPIPNISKLAGSSLPSGVKFKDNNDGTATISGAIKGKATTGSDSFTLQAKNKNGTVQQQFTINW